MSGFVPGLIRRGAGIADEPVAAAALSEAAPPAVQDFEVDETLEVDTAVPTARGVPGPVEAQPRQVSALRANPGNAPPSVSPAQAGTLQRSAEVAALQAVTASPVQPRAVETSNEIHADQATQSLSQPDHHPPAAVAAGPFRPLDRVTPAEPPEFEPVWRELSVRDQLPASKPHDAGTRSAQASVLPRAEPPTAVATVALAPREALQPRPGSAWFITAAPDVAPVAGDPPRSGIAHSPAATPAARTRRAAAASEPSTPDVASGSSWLRSPAQSGVQDRAAGIQPDAQGGGWGPIEVHIGTIELHSPPAALPVVPRPVGFDEFANTRSYGRGA
jgi:hypothetical protein